MLCPFLIAIKTEGWDYTNFSIWVEVKLPSIWHTSLLSNYIDSYFQNLLSLGTLVHFTFERLTGWLGTLDLVAVTLCYVKTHGTI